MKESEHGLIRFIVHLQVIKAVAAWRKPVTLKTRIRTGWEGTQKRRRPAMEHNAVTKLVDRVFQIEATQERICGNFGCAQNIAPAIGLGLAEAQQLLHTTFCIAPDPTMQRSQHPIECCGTLMGPSGIHSASKDSRLERSGLSRNCNFLWGPVQAAFNSRAFRVSIGEYASGT